MSAPHIVIAGGGYVGLYTALGLQRKLRKGEARVTVIDPRPTMTYQPFLPEAAAGSPSPGMSWSRSGRYSRTAR